MITPPRSTPEPIVIPSPGVVLVLTDEQLNVVLRALISAAQRASSNGLPANDIRVSLIRQLAPHMSASGHADVREPAKLHHQERQTKRPVPVKEAAEQLGMSERQARRLAPKLNGHKVGNSWVLDQAAIDEHRKGQNR